MNHDRELTPAELRKAAMGAIVREVGADGLVRFLQDESLGSGDYVVERKKLLREYPTAADVFAGIKQMKENSKVPAKRKRPSGNAK